ncbi:hypothetical protein MXB_4629, partial [Myxobolus squamalis]
MARYALTKFSSEITGKLNEIKNLGLYRNESIIRSRQGTRITIDNNQEVLNFSSNNYLGLTTHPAVIKKSVETTTARGVGVSSARQFGTLDIHRELEKTVATFHGRPDAITYMSSYDANIGLFETLFKEGDAVLIDEFSHFSLFDAITLSHAQGITYKHQDMEDLERKLNGQRKDFKNVIIATDGVFPMNGCVALVNNICDLAEKYDSLTFVDDCLATGILGHTGRGTEQYCQAPGRIDIINSTFGKAIGGAAGGYTTSEQEIVDYLRQFSKPYISSSALPPSLVGSAIAAFELMEKDLTILKNLKSNVTLFRKKMMESNFIIL